MIHPFYMTPWTTSANAHLKKLKLTLQHQSFYMLLLHPKLSMIHISWPRSGSAEQVMQECIIWRES